MFRFEPAGFDPAVAVSFIPQLDRAGVALGEQAWRKARDDGAALDLDAALRRAFGR